MSRSRSTSRAAPGRRRSWKGRAVALALGYALVEVAVMPIVAQRMPLRMRVALPSPLYVLGEPSKAGLLPHDYALVLGDSYAEGQGDWLVQALTGGGNPPFHAVDLVHRGTGVDLITFGRGGASSLTATAFLVQKRTAALARFGLEAPSDVLLYVYEGNDFLDNLADARRYLAPGGSRRLTACPDAELDALVSQLARRGLREGVPGTLTVPYLFLNLIKGDSAGVDRGHREIPLVAVEGELPGFNVLGAGGRAYFFDGPAEGPGLSLGDDEIELSLRLLGACLRWSAVRFEGARIQVVYVPSPLACYEVLSPRVRVKLLDRERPDFHGAESVAVRSALLRERTRRVVAETGLSFVDATPALRAAGRTGLVHGPLDGYHLNRRGYTVLAEVLTSALLQGRGGGHPAVSKAAARARR